MTEQFTNRRFFATLATLVLLLIVVMLMSACSPVDDPEVTSCLPKEAAEALALANASMIGGKVFQINDTSDSMKEISNHAYVVLVEAWNEIKVGDIIAFVARDGSLTIHSVVSCNGVSIKTAGTNNDRSDAGFVTRKDYLGTMIIQIYHAG